MYGQYQTADFTAYTHLPCSLTYVLYILAQQNYLSNIWFGPLIQIFCPVTGWCRATQFPALQERGIIDHSWWTPAVSEYVFIQDMLKSILWPHFELCTFQVEVSILRWPTTQHADLRNLLFHTLWLQSVRPFQCVSFLERICQLFAELSPKTHTLKQAKWLISYLMFYVLYCCIYMFTLCCSMGTLQ